MGIITALNYAAIVNSRQPLRPSRQSTWVKGAVDAIRWVEQAGLGLISSVGVPSWELTTALGSIRNLPMSLLIPTEDTDRFAGQCAEVVEQFDLNADLVNFKQCSPKARDRLAIESADLIIPISIRTEGTLKSLIEQAEQEGKSFKLEFKTPYEKRNRRLAYTLEGMDLNPKLHQLSEGLVIHWTRATNRPWPDERLIDFYTDIANSERYPRLAIHTLQHILDQEVILGSSRNIGSGATVVSLSTLRPHELVRLVRWRSRRKLMSFEPYGIGFLPELAERLGIKPVIYYDRDEGPPARIEEWRCQSSGTITDWRVEKEMRCQGEIRLTDLPKDQMTLFCLTKVEALLLEKRCRIKTLPFLGR